MEITQIQNTNKTCCICLEDIDDYISCNYCKEGIYCKNCLTGIIRNDNTYTCSICRRENNYVLIILTEETKEDAENTIIGCFYIKNIIREICIFIFKALKILILLYIAFAVILFILYILSL